MFRSRSSCCDCVMRVPSLRALQAQLALVFALVQITEVGLFSGALEVGCQTPLCGAICLPSADIRELRIGPKESRDLLRLHFVHVVGIGLQRWIDRFKLRLHLIPGEGLLRARIPGQRSERNPQAA